MVTSAVKCLNAYIYITFNVIFYDVVGWRKRRWRRIPHFHTTPFTKLQLIWKFSLLCFMARNDARWMKRSLTINTLFCFIKRDVMEENVKLTKCITAIRLTLNPYVFGRRASQPAVPSTTRWNNGNCGGQNRSSLPMHILPIRSGMCIFVLKYFKYASNWKCQK